MSGLGFSTSCMGVPREREIWFQSGCFGGKSKYSSICRGRLGLWVKNLTAVTRAVLILRRVHLYIVLRFR